MRSLAYKPGTRKKGTGKCHLGGHVTVSRPKDREADPDKRQSPGVRTKIYVRDDMIGAGKVDLLRVVAETGSISGAAKKMGLGYRRAWFLLETLQRCFAAPLFVTLRGGPGAGGTQLTDLGRELLARHAEHEAQVQEISAGFVAWLEENQP